MIGRRVGALLIFVILLPLLAAFCGSGDGGLVNLTKNPGTSDRSPSWSPDGNKILFVSYVEPPVGSIEPSPGGGIYVMDADGSDRTQVSGYIARSVSWSPDGNRIVYASGSSIITMDADGTNRELVVGREMSVYDITDWPSYSPDGSKILFALATGGIFVVGIDGSDQTQLSPEGVVDYYPAWSPDGTKIAFNSERDGHPEIYVMNADGSNPTRLTENTVGDFSPAWSPDGSSIAFVSTRDGQADIYIMDADGSDVTRLTENSIFEISLSWSPDGTKIAFCGFSDSDQPDIYVLKVP